MAETIIETELDGRVVRLPLREWNKIGTRAKMAIRPDGAMAGKPINAAIRALVRQFLNQRA